ncbi:MAG: methionyl-tRNA formyltransferase [Proteobacteria bacterium]|jgi:methionyl-tRNA formyltransferase|nr:methionyl-tRNA formyltransferase [Pseudomonadota bacterium]
MLRLVFFGTPEFAVPALNLLINSNDIEVLAVITQPDKPVGRKQILTAPPVKDIALKHGIPVFQPEKLNLDELLFKTLSDLKPDALVTVAYGQILKGNYLNLSSLGVVNLHASLLPKYRGPAPINWMLINGEKEIGVSTMLSDAGVDTGPVLLSSEMLYVENETAQELTLRMSHFGADLLLSTLLKLNFNEGQEFSKGQVQQGFAELAVFEQLAPFMTKDLGLIDFFSPELHFSSPNSKQAFFKFSKPNSAENIHNLIRGTYPWPGAYFMFRGEKVVILETAVADEELKSPDPGTIVKVNHKEGFIWVQTFDGILQIYRLKPSGKAEMKASDCLNGFRLKEGDLLI